MEYPGNENSTRDLLLHLFDKFRKVKLAPESIQFGQIGRSSMAHIAAYQTFTYGRSPDKRLIFEDYYELLDKTAEIRTKALMKRKIRNMKTR